MKKSDLIHKLKQLPGISDEEKAYLINLVNTKKKYGLVWEDKPEDVEEQLRDNLPVLKEVKERAIINGDVTLSGAEVPNHILIEGDNLHALTALTFTHEGKIDVIYIDPPYNTGNKDFKYNDTFVDKEDSYRHSKWLGFMSKRLEISKRLLSDTGIIFVSIDDNEQANLKLLLDDVFGEMNFVSSVPRVAKRTSDKGTHFRPTKDYLLVYAKSIQLLPEFGVAKRINESDYDLVEADGRKYKQSGASLFQPSLDSRPNQRYYIQAPDGSLIIPPGNVFPSDKKDGAKIKPLSNSDKVWRWSVETYEKQKHLLMFTKGSAKNPLLDENGNQSKWNIYPKVYLEDDKEATLHPEDIIYDYPNSQG
ncbi:MAG: site-specific DNA-methyltransferase, partial [Bacteroidetes bacterium]|nr:site-specific DNA-methyltransferase [Bacteroidota bacterium]